MPNTFVDINVERGTLAIVGALLDYFVTAGIATTSLGLCGMLKPSISKLEPRTGEFCARAQVALLQGKKETVDPAAAVALVSSRPCPFSQLDCKLMKKTVCSATKTQFDQLFNSLEKKGALVRSLDEWSVPI